MGVVTGIPMEFQFGTNWSRFSRFSGEVIGQALAMEGVFAFFLESTFLGLFLFGEKRLGPRRHLAAAVALSLGSWLSGYFIIVANAFMQHPVGYRAGRGRRPPPRELLGVPPQPVGVVAVRPHHGGLARHGVVRRGRRRGLLVADRAATPRHAGICLRAGVIAGLVASLLVAFPTGDGHGKMVAEYQPVTLAAMEGLFDGGPYAELAIIGQPDVAARRLENPVVVPGDPELPGLRVVREHRPRAERLPEGPVAARRRAALLQLPHHGRARDALHPDDGRRVVPALAGAAGDRAPACSGC